ncbi:MAG: oligopeptide transporter, OPT family [Gemmatimonadales bacterium]|nr:oligopeptide transporter, OPT family [Gemmatimonadales bacterium]NIN12499.1 oligopeptide transporter, OPT family [Gemmatimonadales bacterium]NIN50870.1 oligopeptide transporter, OPT family [Gemmatimonadales bacterium]NIP08334.1 oligopeptide transporter, OPT family [Gemmatimonadales bacterium]NIR03431.1 oligopeptide transporter, OPT family [Gemmatimonadales bacterium]
MKARKLPKTAYVIEEGQEHVPFTYGQILTEFTVKAVIAGVLLGVVFGAANTYLGLKAGLTISTSIPVAVLTVVAFRLFETFGLRHSILESNMSQTVGSASSSVASGVLFTIPALFIWGMSPAWRQITLLAMAGGLIGVLAMIPLRRFLIKREHGKLPYPEGMACAEVLVAAEEGGKQAANVFWGIGVGMLFKLITDGFKFVQGTFQFALGYKANVAISVSPPLIGVGYILGMRIATVMVAGGALSALIIIPLINWWGGGLTEPLYPETEKLIRDMSAGEIWHRYVRYIGAGAVATGGIITLIRSIPTMVESFRLGLGQIGRGIAHAVEERTDLDLSFKTVVVFVVAVLVMLTLVPGILGYLDSIPIRAVASVLIAIFAFFFVTVSSRIVGLVGVTSNPTSGMTIATLLGTSLVFFLMGWTDMAGKATALMVGTAVCIAASIAGDTSQDLKTGFVLGATPRFQQIGELVGVITSAGVVCLVVMMLHQNVEGGLGGAELPAPQAVLMKLVIDGVLDQSLPWVLIIIGVGIGLVASLFRIPVLAFAVGVYLPLSTMAAVFLGGLARYVLTRDQIPEEAERRREQGVLFGSGLVGGGGLTGVVLALWVGVRGGRRIEGFPLDLPDPGTQVLAGLTIAAIIAILVLMVKRSRQG